MKRMIYHYGATEEGKMVGLEENLDLKFTLLKIKENVDLQLERIEYLEEAHAAAAAAAAAVDGWPVVGGLASPAPHPPSTAPGNNSVGSVQDLHLSYYPTPIRPPKFSQEEEAAETEEEEEAAEVESDSPAMEEDEGTVALYPTSPEFDI